MNKLFDLRFVIGSFFSIIGILLLIYGFLIEAGAGSPVNKWCGGAFVVFGVIMILLSLRKDASDELLESDGRH
jgi:hypothetical protein